MSRRIICALSLLLTGFLQAHAETPIQVSLCALVASPQSFNNQLVRVRAEAHLEFEDFSLHVDSCSPDATAVWLAYGGDQPTPTTSTVDDNVRKPGSLLHIKGRAVPLQMDSSLDLFQKRLMARRIETLNGEGCTGSQCYFYRVTATFTGIFLTAGKGTTGGYGHLGCCYLLAIEHVSDVDARRTPVPAGGQFDCTDESWEMTALEAQRVTQARIPVHHYHDLSKSFAPQLALLAKHWNEKIADEQFHLSGALMGAPEWQSEDLSKSYKLESHYRDGKRKTRLLEGGTAHRQVCRAKVAPVPSEIPIGCKTFRFAPNPTNQEKALDGTAWRNRSLAQEPREAVLEVAREGRINVLPELAFRGCDKPAKLDGTILTSCRWVDSMQAFWIELSKQPHHFQKMAEATWTISNADALECRLDPVTATLRREVF
jgi:hypothetical protein